jgi:hypothetical protein
MKFIEKFTSNCEHVFMNLKGEKQQQPETSNVQRHGSSKPGLYTLMEVLVMTKNFAKKIGENHFGTMYHGKLQTRQKVAVKVWELRPHSAAKEFHQFETFCGDNERCCEHIVKVFGYCEEGDKQISIYEYMPGGTLQQHLYDKGFLDSKTHALDWKTRLQIALHIAQGMQYFGEQYPILRTNNIFLTKNWVPKSMLNESPNDFPSLSRRNPGYPIIIHEFGRLLWELISGQPHGRGLNDLVLSLNLQCIFCLHN